MLTKIFPEIPEIQKILYILSEVDRIKSRQRHPIYNLNQKPSVIFNDPGLKSAVINQLMYRQSKLKPTFDIKLFAEEYTACFINPELRGASIEAGEYMYETMEKYPKVFPFIVTNIIKVGELSRNNGRSC